MRPLDASIHLVRRRFNAAVCLNRLRTWAAVACVLAGAIVLAVRWFAPGHGAWLPALTALVPAVLVATWLDARRRFYTRADAVTWLDSRAGAGGLLMAADCTQDAGWRVEAEARVAGCPRPQPRFRHARWGLLLAPWCIFLILALLTPPRQLAGDPTRFSTVGGQAVARLEARFGQLNELGLLDEQDARLIDEQTIQKLRGEQASAFDQENWRKIDQAHKALDTRQAEANHQLDAARQPLEQACKTLAEDATGQPKLSDQQKRELAAAMQKLAESNFKQLAPERLRRQLAELAKRMESGQEPLPTDPEQLRQMCQNARQFAEDMEQAMEQAGCRNQPGEQRQPGQVDPQAGLDDFDLQPGEDLGEFELSEGQPGEGPGVGGQGEGEDGQGPDDKGEGQGAGRGGRDRGRGDAPMLWGAESSRDNARFKPMTLPRGAILNPKTGQLLGLSSGAPRANPDGSSATGGARGFDPTTGGPANRRDYSPIYRGPIRRYFEQSSQ